MERIDLNRHGVVDRSDRRPDRRHYSLRIDGRAHSDHRAGKWIEAIRPIDFRPRLFIKTEMPYVAHDTDDGCPRSLCSIAEVDALPNRVAPGPELRRHGFINDRDVC